MYENIVNKMVVYLYCLVGKCNHLTLVKSIIKQLNYSAGETPVSKKKPTKTVPLKEVLGRVIFVLSGFQNPQRGQLRDKALQMGARYEGEWNKKCTHLM